ncbi:MAG: S-layer homology domain-containing protein [Ruminiclostridium sp.]|nr:S-layer homology domain-containing protein [Ruminiclostridium sp.]
MAMSLSLAVTAGATYTDDSKISAKYDVAVEVASQLGILEGFEDGSYRPQGTLTRAQLATMTYRITTGDVEDDYTANFASGAAESFTDTPATAWYAGYVGYAADAGYLKGMGDGTYAPDSALTGYQALAAFLRAIGYNEPGQFTGADWTVQVALVANQVGALEGIKGVDLNAAISREVAAQIIYNILFSNLVEFTHALGYQDFGGIYGTLAENEFKIDSYAKAVPTAPWGQPAQEWYNSSDEVLVSVPYAPVTEYTVAVTECQLAKDLGVKETVQEADITEYKNGASNGVIAGAINLTDTTTEVGAQGTLTEVYEIDGDYWFVQIETWLAKAGTVTEAKYDGNGHQTSKANTAFTVYGPSGNGTWNVETSDFAEDSYVLINKSTFDGTKYFVTATAPVDTAVLNEVDRADKQSTIGGTTYDWAAKYALGNPAIAGNTYDVFVDFYGNLIGLVKFVEETEYEYTILDNGIFDSNGYDSAYYAKIVDLSNGDLDVITVDSYVNTSGNSILNWGDKEPTYKHNIVAYAEAEDGYEVKNVATTNGTSFVIEKGEPEIKMDGAFTIATDNNTVYAVENECGEYDIYTGYTNVPTMYGGYAEGVHIRAFAGADDDVYADLVYIDASAALFAGEEYFAYVLEGAADIGGGELADETAYEIVSNVVINGEVVKVRTQDGEAYEITAMAGEFVTLYTDADGLVFDAVEDTGFEDYEVYADNSDEVIWVAADESYAVAADTIIWIVDEASNEVAIGTADDIDEGKSISMKLDGTKPVAIIIWDTID